MSSLHTVDISETQLPGYRLSNWVEFPLASLIIILTTVFPKFPISHSKEASKTRNINAHHFSFIIKSSHGHLFRKQIILLKEILHDTFFATTQSSSTMENQEKSATGISKDELVLSVGLVMKKNLTKIRYSGSPSCSHFLERYAAPGSQTMINSHQNLTRFTMTETKQVWVNTVQIFMLDFWSFDWNIKS
ncbi:hypothetical protein K435DRAFT_802085 [Dendrothele bispora CBS 962.96]|uniref:Uncharacterized protein n=1 Tax=Dendrothele bispora (strain CBS 962.96) TaxID=1314807 RepID=A0A4S8LM41_DENBC|nr:hypothetical protein K435DRAFT_802085 [Dendrothele bispora CBS 962.96]